MFGWWPVMYGQTWMYRNKMQMGQLTASSKLRLIVTADVFQDDDEEEAGVKPKRRRRAHKSMA